MKLIRLKKPLLVVLFFLLASLTVFACGGSDDDDDDSAADNDPANMTASFNEVDCYGRDWVELITSQETTVDLGGWILTDNPENEEHTYVIPEGTTLGPTEYLVVKNEKDEEDGFPFGIKCGEDTIYLLNKNNEVVDQIEVMDTPNGSTVGLLPDRTGDWQETLPTQGEFNQLPYTLTESLFDPFTVHEIDIELDAEAESSLSTTPFEYAKGEFSISGDELNFGPINVGLRLKSGLSFKPMGDKAAFKIRFGKFVEGQRLFGLKNLALNNMIQDPSMVRETLAYRIFRDAGVPASRTGYAWIRVNGEDYGLYVIIEKYDDIFLDDYFDDTGHLYEGSADLYAGQEINFEVDEGDETDISDLTNLIDIINKSENSTWYNQVDAVSDLDEMSNVWAIENYIGHQDGYAMAANNYFLHSNDSGYFSMMPWGTDECFGEINDIPKGASVAFYKCLENTSCENAFNKHLAEVAEVVDNLESDSFIDAVLSAIEDEIEEDPKNLYSMDEHESAVLAVKNFIIERSE